MEYKLSGGAVLNVVRYAVLMGLQDETNASGAIMQSDLVDRIRRELQKEGKTL